MYLVDTSVWIDYLRKKETRAASYLINMLDQKIPFGITSVIYQEILQGANTTKTFNELASCLKKERFYYPKNPLTTYEAAARIYFNARKKGMTIRSTIDCLIAQIAIEHQLQLLHNDNDFLNIQKIAPELNLVFSH